MNGSRRRGPGRPRATPGPSTEQRILASAREVFSEQGYERATIQEIAERAGLSRPAVNHYFSGKEALYHVVFESTRDRVVAESIADAAESEVLSARFSTFLHAAAKVDSSDRSFARFIASSLLDAFRHPELRERATDQLEEIRSFISQALRTAVDRGEVRPDLDVPATAEMLLAVMWGMGLYAGFIGSHDQLESVVDQFTRLIDGTLW
ncbi:MAG TPA: TetR/AcrR family transcriptional regulator [Pseudonocardia sp.]